MQKVKLGDICEILDNQRVPITASERKAGPYPYYGANGLQDYVNGYIFDDELVLLAEDGGNFGSKEKPIAYRVSGKCWVNNHAHVLKPKENIDVNYLCYSLMFYDVRGLVNGATRQKLTQKDMRKMTIPLTSIEEQKAIAEKLDKVSSLIEKRKQQLLQLDLLVKSQFIEMFEKGKRYEKIFFGDVCLFVRNGANITQTKGASGYPITRIETLSNDVFNADRLGYADIMDLSRYTSYLLQKGDILISHINSVAYLGRAVQYKGEVSSPVIHGMNLLCARIKADYNPTYIEWYLKSKRAKDYIATITKKAVNQASITTSDLKKMSIPVPPKEEQERFAHFVEQTDKSKFRVKQSLAALELLKKSLMQKYFG